MEAKAEAPLLEVAASAGGRSSGRATAAQTLGNIVVSIVGTGVLGLPYAFRVAGWLAGSLGVAAAGVSTYYCMLLIVSVYNNCSKSSTCFRIIVADMSPLLLAIRCINLLMSSYSKKETKKRGKGIDK